MFREHIMASLGGASLERTAMRCRIEQTIEFLISMLDEIDGDADREPDDDSEPSLGWHLSGSGSSNRYTTPDLEIENDDEPSLGWTEVEDQASPYRFGEQVGDDLEGDGLAAILEEVRHAA